MSTYSFVDKYTELVDEVHAAVIDLLETHEPDTLPDVGAAPTSKPLLLIPTEGVEEELLIDGYPVVAADNCYAYTSSQYAGMVHLQDSIAENLQAWCHVIDAQTSI